MLLGSPDGCGWLRGYAEQPGDFAWLAVGPLDIASVKLDYCNLKIVLSSG